MAENTEIEDRVDFDEDNYSSEEEEEPMEDDGTGEGGEEIQEDARSEDDRKEQSQGSDKNDMGNENGGDDEDSGSVSNEDKKKHAELLGLPPHGSEIFIGGLTRETTEEDLAELCEPFGEISEIRLVKNRDTGESKGFAFVAYKTRDVAQKAIEELHSKDYKGRTLRCSLSETKYRLFIGNVPKSWTYDEFKKVIDSTGPGSETIELIKDPQNPSRNRGFAFVEYYNNACADYSRQKMSSASFKLDGNTPTVTWADPKQTSESSAASSQVKALYVKNIPENTNTEELKELFQQYGEVTKVVMPPAKSGGKRDFGFVHYAERSSALKAVNEKFEVHGQMLEVVLAKPQSDKRFDSSNPHNTTHLPNYIPHPGYAGIPVNPYAPLTAGYGAAAAGYQQQPMIYGRGPMPAGMQMVPMVLPDGQIGYVLQQPGVQMATPARPRRNDRGNGGGGPQGRGGSDDRNRRYRPY